MGQKAKLGLFRVEVWLLSAKACRPYREKFSRLLERAVAVIVEIFNSHGDGLLPITNIGLRKTVRTVSRRGSLGVFRARVAVEELDGKSPWCTAKFATNRSLKSHSSAGEKPLLGLIP